MSVELLSVGLDILVLIFLGITIYYALKLSRSLNSFRAYRKEFDGLIKELGKNIEDAYSAIENMRKSGNESGKGLEAVLKESRFLADELQLINETGNSLAERLESLAEKNGIIAQELNSEYEYDEQLYKHVEQVESKFTIQDKEFIETFKGDKFSGNDSGLQSQAEQELFRAIQKHKKQAAH